jgi:hypothetical protein
MAASYVFFGWLLGEGREWLALAGAFLVSLLAWNVALSWVLKRGNS